MKKITGMGRISAYDAVMQEPQDSVVSDARPAVRLRQPQRSQLEMRVQCPDDLVGADHSVRMVAAVVERLNISKFCEDIKAGEGEVGRDATDPGLLISLWLYAGCMPVYVALARGGSWPGDTKKASRFYGCAEG